MLMFNKSLVQLSVDWLGCVPSLLFDLRPNYGGGNEDNSDLLQKILCMHCCTQCPWPSSRPPLIHASAGDSQTLMGKSGSVSCGVTAPFSWSWCAQGSVCASKSLFPQSSLSSGSSVVGSTVTSSKRACAIPKSAAPRAPAPATVHCWPIPPQETLRHSSVSLWGVWVLVPTDMFQPPEHLWQLWGLILNVIFAPPTILLGLLCPWT